ncbi:hypothetical protein RJ639_038655 [Escallonia herrerae]|uniref:WAT1-related protein n=1 Tax=Escallonia herrerae TaxID=1293975 RepID=A0AA89B738_9ASTE|nr:hypothetical protein RJ639_038655 [Escallonia herrerae]
MLTEYYSLWQLLRGAKPYLAVIYLQFGYAGMSILADIALNQGMSHYTFAVYRNAIATAVFTPFALVLERPVIDQNLYYTGMKYTTATFATAMCNIVPAITFSMAWIFRLEKVNIMRRHSQGKILGTVVTVGGAMIMTLVKGPTLGLPWVKNKSHYHSTASRTYHQDHVKGSLMVTAGCFCWASFIILQAVTLKSYPAALSLVSLICMMGAVQGTIVTLLVEKGNTAIWTIRWDTKLLAAVYGGVIGSGVNYYVSGVVMKEKGPVFVTAFNPLGMVVVVIMGSIFLAEQLDLGRIVGAIVIVVGLYLVIWGKSKDQSSSETDRDQVAQIDHETNTANDAKTSKHDIVSITQPVDEAV